MPLLIKEIKLPLIYLIRLQKKKSSQVTFTCAGDTEHHFVDRLFAIVDYIIVTRYEIRNTNSQKDIYFTL